MNNFDKIFFISMGFVFGVIMGMDWKYNYLHHDISKVSKKCTEILEKFK